VTPCTRCSLHKIERTPAQVGEQLLKMLATAQAEATDAAGATIARTIMATQVDILAWELKGVCVFCSIKRMHADEAARKVAA
jgi:hypothetical protein